MDRIKKVVDADYFGCREVCVMTSRTASPGIFSRCWTDIPFELGAAEPAGKLSVVKL
jgi:hypothetical protein